MAPERQICQSKHSMKEDVRGRSAGGDEAFTFCGQWPVETTSYVVCDVK